MKIKNEMKNNDKNEQQKWMNTTNTSLEVLPNIENDPIIKDKMAGLSCLFVFTFGNFLAPVLIAAHTANNIDFGDKPKNEDYESEGP